MKNIKNIFAALMLSTLLSGCGLYAKFDKSVELEIPDSLYSYIEATSDSVTLASLGWKEVFTDEKLCALIEQGLESNTDLNLARLNVEQAEVSLKSARYAYTPTLDISAGASFNKVAAKTTSIYTGAVSAGWEIDLFGRLRNAKQQSKAALEQSDAYRRAVQTQLISSIAINYYTLVMLDEQLAITLKTLEMWSENIRTVEGLLRAGRVDNTSVLQAKANRAALQSGIVSLEESIKVAENNLSVLLKITPQHIERGGGESFDLPEDLKVGLPMQLLSNRPDVQVAEYELMQAFYAVGVARSSLYPSLSLTGSVSYSDGSGVVTNPAELIYNLAGSILQPIFNRRTLRANLEISKLQQEQSLLSFNQAVLDAGAEVNLSFIEYKSACESVEYELQQIEYLQGAVRSSELMMVHGTSSYLEVLTAQQSLLSAELSFTSSIYSQRQGVINLYRALGGGVK